MGVQLKNIQIQPLYSSLLLSNLYLLSRESYPWEYTNQQKPRSLVIVWGLCRSPRQWNQKDMTKAWKIMTGTNESREKGRQRRCVHACWPVWLFVKLCVHITGTCLLFIPILLLKCKYVKSFKNCRTSSSIYHSKIFICNVSTSYTTWHKIFDIT